MVGEELEELEDRLLSWIAFGLPKPLEELEDRLLSWIAFERPKLPETLALGLELAEELALAALPGDVRPERVSGAGEPLLLAGEGVSTGLPRLHGVGGDHVCHRKIGHC